ncbi:hypothetical protein [Parvularcula sp. LCG005]|uniref:hypothetical protein n=1 Tax=Parvularcula sp. LCG005 TaxID=3078805 RepID=UPI002942ED57|nr:hypothetical protein [Parvularcula sp. LCG005]WOI52052.1 hypothetical protein RUI03_07765 [Parvularcula sp. LCG005]
MAEGTSATKKSRFQLGIGFILFVLLIGWALWHGIIGPRVIAPVYTNEAPPPLDYDREPPRDESRTVGDRSQSAP